MGKKITWQDAARSYNDITEILNNDKLNDVQKEKKISGVLSILLGIAGITTGTIGIIASASGLMLTMYEANKKSVLYGQPIPLTLLNLNREDAKTYQRAIAGMFGVSKLFNIDMSTAYWGLLKDAEENVIGMSNGKEVRMLKMPLLNKDGTFQGSKTGKVSTQDRILLSPLEKLNDISAITPDKHNFITLEDAEKFRKKLGLNELTFQQKLILDDEYHQALQEARNLLIVKDHKSNEDGRIAAMNELPLDQRVTVLENIAKNGHEKEKVRVAAIYKLFNQKILGDIAKNWNENEKVRVAAINNLTNQKILGDIVKNWSKNEKVRLAAIDKISNQRVLGEIATLKVHGNFDLQIRTTALNKVSDQKVLVNIYKNVKQSDNKIRMEIVKKLTDQAKLADIAQYKYKKVFSFDVPKYNNEILFTIVDKITKQNLLSNIALNKESSYPIRKMAIEKLKDQATLADIARDKSNSFYVRHSAIIHLQNPKLLTNLLKNLDLSGLKQATTDRLTELNKQEENNIRDAQDKTIAIPLRKLSIEHIYNVKALNKMLNDKQDDSEIHTAIHDRIDELLKNQKSDNDGSRENAVKKTITDSLSNKNESNKDNIVDTDGDGKPDRTMNDNFLHFGEFPKSDKNLRKTNKHEASSKKKETKTEKQTGANQDVTGYWSNQPGYNFFSDSDAKKTTNETGKDSPLPWIDRGQSKSESSQENNRKKEKSQIESQKTQGDRNGYWDPAGVSDWQEKQKRVSDAANKTKEVKPVGGGDVSGG